MDKYIYSELDEDPPDGVTYEYTKSGRRISLFFGIPIREGDVLWLNSCGVACVSQTKITLGNHYLP